MDPRIVRKLSPVPALTIMLALIVTGCGGQATTAPATEAATGGQWCSGVRIVFFPGGPEGGVFAVNVYNGAKQAQADLGPTVHYVWSDWNVSEDDPAVPGIGRNPAGRDCRHGASRRRSL